MKKKNNTYRSVESDLAKGRIADRITAAHGQ